MSSNIVHPKPSPSSSQMTKDKSGPSAAITQERVAAAFEAWFTATRRNEIKEPCEVPFQIDGETDNDYADRLAAGLFKYLEKV